MSTETGDRYGVIGSPIAHSKSPVIHEMFASQTKQALTYSAIEVPKTEAAAFVRRFFAEGGRGLNVTVPNKEEAFAVADITTPRATLARAVNTLSTDGEGHLIGDNTDGAGLLGDLLNNYGVSLAGKRVLMLGAGGASRGVLAAIADLPEGQGPATIVVANRTLAKAEALSADLAGKLSVQPASYADAASQAFDLIINGTSASLSGELPPLSPAMLAPGCCCYDMMYAAKPTPFIEWAQINGASLAIDGLGMLVGQAAESFFIWRGIRPETKPVIDALRAAN